MPVYQPSPQLKIHYYDSPPSMGKPVLLLHGLGSNSASWGLQTPVLEDAGFRVIAPDTRGFGRSTFPGGRTSIGIFAADIAGLIEHLGIHRIDVIGISMGGTIALQLALTQPGMVQRLVLINTFSSLRPERPGVWVYFLTRFFLVHTLGLQSQAEFVSKRIFPGDDKITYRQMLYQQICQADIRGYRAAMRALARFNVSSRLKEISCPTLVVTGEKDTTVTPDNQKKLLLGIPQARQVIIPGGGHAVIADQPDLVNTQLLAFLNHDQSKI